MILNGGKESMLSVPTGLFSSKNEGSLLMTHKYSTIYLCGKKAGNTSLILFTTLISAKHTALLSSSISIKTLTFGIGKLDASSPAGHTLFQLWCVEQVVVDTSLPCILAVGGNSIGGAESFIVSDSKISLE